MGILSLFSKEMTSTSNTEDFSALFTKEVLINILKNTNTMMMIFTAEDGWIEANESFLNTMGYEGIHEFRHQYPSVRDMLLSECEEIFTENDKSWLEYIKKYKKDGHYVRLYNAQNEILDINLKCMSVTNSKGIYILEFEDVTKLYFANKQIQEIEVLKTKLLASLGHEFRTPMNGIIGFVDLLSQTKLDESQKEYIHLIKQSSKSLISNVETLLDLSQLQSGRLTLDNSDFELIAHLEELISNHMIIAKERGIKIFCFIDPKLPKEINSDIRKIKQIMNALIQNAIKFTQRGGEVVVEVKLLKKQETGACSVGFSVKDNGIGISKDEINDIEKPFHLGNGVENKTGVGLSISSGLIKLFQSKLHIKSEEGNGSYFNFTLNFDISRGQSYTMMPKHKAKVLLLDKKRVNEANFLSAYLRSFAVDVIKSSVFDEKIYDGVDSLYIVASQNDLLNISKLNINDKKTPVTILLEEDEEIKAELNNVIDAIINLPIYPSILSKHLEKMNNIHLSINEHKPLAMKDQARVLVVEDNFINQKLMQIMLQEYKISADIVSNGNEAVEICKENDYDVIYMDIDMPEKNGIVATQEIKARADMNKNTTIIAFTALAMQGDKEKLLEEGLDDYLPKPLTREKLERSLSKYL